MDWLGRLTRRSPPPGTQRAEEATPGVETAAPGVAVMLDELAENGSHAVLDLGPAAPSNLRVYSRFASRIRFADLTGQAASSRGRGPADQFAQALPPQPDQPYDLVFAWDVLDRLLPEYHAPLVARLVEVTAPGARLHVVVSAGEKSTTRPLRLMLLDTEHMRYEHTGPARPALPRLLPAQVAQVLKPFRVIRGFTLKGDLREYVAAKGEADEPESDR